ncbi:MAG: MlaD family protein [Mariniphaga sp.]|nr:MlaD family protein [Mariniphaga sp.]
MKISKYTRLGVLIVLSITILIWGLSYLKGEDILKKNDQFHVIYNRVDGLSISNDVVLSGFKIGQVKNISFLPDHSGRLLVTFVIDASVKIPVNSVAQIVSSDLMGTRMIRINLSKATEYYAYNDTLPGDVERDLKEEVSMQVLPIKNKAEELLGTIDSAITVLTVIFNEEARENLSESFENLNQTIYNIEKTTGNLQDIVSLHRGNIESTLTNIEKITSAFNHNIQEFEKIIRNISAFSDTLGQLRITPLLDNIHGVTEQLSLTLMQLQSKDNTAGLLLNDDELYQAILVLAEQLNLLTNDLRVNPERYLKFSAFDLGRKVYVNASGQTTDEIIFKIHLVSSENQIPVQDDHFRGLEPVEEIETGGIYNYLTGTTDSFSEIMEAHQQALKKFPNASIVAFKNGRLIKLEKALKNLR